MNKKVLILMSTFNGGERIQRQVRSIMEQKGVETHLLVRDDGSGAETIKILQIIRNTWADRITCIYESNRGWKSSFMKLLYLAGPGYDYYGFSDQDDVWFEDKILTCVQMMLGDGYKGAKLSHCNSLSVDDGFGIRKEQEKRTPVPPNHKAAIATEYFQGCGMVWNHEAMKLIKSYYPGNSNLAHDYWVGLICYFFGKIYFSQEPRFYHIRYSGNSSEDGNVLRGRIKRLKLFFSNSHTYMNPSSDLLKGFKKYLTEEDYEFCSRLRQYKAIPKHKIILLFDRKFRRPSGPATVLLKCAILLGRY